MEILMAKGRRRKRDEEMTPEELEKALKNRARVAAWRAIPGNKERAAARTDAWLKDPANKKRKEDRQKERRKERIADPAEAAKLRAQGRINARRYSQNPKNRDKVRESQRKQDAKPERKAKKNARHKAKYRQDPAFAEGRRAYINNYYAQNKEYRQKTLERALARQRRPEVQKQRLARHLEKYATDPAYRFAWLMRQAVRRAFAGTSKPARTFALLGVSRDEAMRIIESRFIDGMTWQNYGAWHIDHIFPLSAVSIGRPIEKRAVCHIDNLQPMWGPENSSKHNKVTPEAAKLFESIIRRIQDDD
jgi:hypothetical protein